MVGALRMQEAPAAEVAKKPRVAVVRIGVSKGIRYRLTSLTLSSASRGSEVAPRVEGFRV